MGKQSKNKHKDSRKALKESRKIDDASLLLAELLDSDRVTGIQINSFNKATEDYPNNNVENPLFILDNIETMKLRLEYFKLSMQDFINKNTDSVTDNMTELLTNNSYITYVQSIIDSVEKIDQKMI